MDGWSLEDSMEHSYLDSLNHQFSFHLKPCVVLPNFFKPQQIRQQVKFSAPTIPTAQQDSSKGKSSSKGKENPKPKAKAADWPVAETKQLLHAWASRFERLKGASNKVRTAIWNEIYTNFKSSWDERERTLRQVKKRQQNLEYEFKQLKVKANKTGEEGLNKIKDGFPCYSIFDQAIGYRDSVDPVKMEIESSSFMPGTLDAHSTPQIISSAAKEREESAATATWLEKEDRPSSSAGVKRGCKELRGKDSRNWKRGRLSDEANGTDDMSSFKEMWKKSLQQENERFEKSMRMLQENQKMQMEQTASLLTGFKDLIKDLVRK